MPFTVTDMVRNKDCHTCTSSYALNLPDYTRSCYRHAGEHWQRVWDATDARAESVLGKRGWPYGPNIDLGSRLRLVAWADEHQLKRSGITRDPAKAIMYGTGRKLKTHGFQNFSNPFWMDHVTLWNRDGKLACLLAQPYAESDRWDDELKSLVQAYPELELHMGGQGSGWYGSGAISIELWRVPKYPHLDWMVAKNAEENAAPTP